MLDGRFSRVTCYADTRQIARQIFGGNMQYRMLKLWEKLQDGDESLDDNCETWSKVEKHFLECTYNPYLFMPMRRAISNTDFNLTQPAASQVKS